ncbi:MAG: hypothetical protein CSA26_02075 [Desulfobacterales bacterium]|nr:MAG: hypothetical protein CSA26_02075 [Desulfobacterales bacterium]
MQNKPVCFVTVLMKFLTAGKQRLHFRTGLTASQTSATNPALVILTKSSIDAELERISSSFMRNVII